MSEHSVIEIGYDVFVHDGDVKVGAVREVHKNTIVVYVENSGDFSVALQAVAEVVEGKVVLQCDKLEPDLKRAINHAHDSEDSQSRSGYPQPPVE
jgi:hypothetical protein